MSNAVSAAGCITAMPVWPLIIAELLHKNSAQKQAYLRVYGIQQYVQQAKYSVDHHIR